jgi:deoxyhypusine monooxygenase
MSALQLAQDNPHAYGKLEALLCSADTPLHHRFRALFTLKNIGDNQAVDIIAKAFADDSALLKHELAYVLGQTRNTHAIPKLSAVLADKTQDPMVRHEAAEALGAIGSPVSLDILQEYLHDPVKDVAETCELAIERIQYEQAQKEQQEVASPYASVDPAPADTTLQGVQALGDKLMDTQETLFNRYRAMFALRNIGTDEAVLQLARGLHDSSALFRHEIAFVFGQMQHPASVPALIQCLEKEDEAGMVRHECAEALGSVGTAECLPVLRKFSTDKERVVRESCLVALDMWEHEQSGEFQYATPIL